MAALLLYARIFPASAGNSNEGGEKNMSDKMRFLDKDYTRRQFLKLSGKSLVGVAMSSTIYCCTE